jgi:hypothetical protein
MKTFGIISLVILLSAIVYFFYLRVVTNNFMSGDTFALKYWYMPIVIAISLLGAMVALTHKK